MAIGTPKTKPAAEVRKEKDGKQQERIAAKQAEASAALEARIAERKAEKAPFEPTVAAPIKPIKEKKARKPKAEAPAAADVSGLVAKIEERVTSKLQKDHTSALKGLATSHKAELKRLVAEHKAAQVGLKAEIKSGLKLMVPKELLNVECAKAYAAGLKAGEKAATKAITAALKGVK